MSGKGFHVVLSVLFLLTASLALGQECTGPDQPCDDGNECTTGDRCVCTLRPPQPEEDFEVEGGAPSPGECSCIGDPVPECPSHPDGPPHGGEIPPPEEEGGPPPDPNLPPPEPGTPELGEEVPNPEHPISPVIEQAPPKPQEQPALPSAISDVRQEPMEMKNLFFCFSETKEAINLTTCNTTMLTSPCPVAHTEEAMQVMAKEIDRIFKEFKKDLSQKKCASLRKQVARYVQGLPAEETPVVVALRLPEKQPKAVASFKSIEKEKLPSFSTCLKTGDMVLNEDKAALKIGLAASERPTLVITAPGGTGGCSLIK